ncbi:hypothetical protein BVI434_2240034 [Burkholderia vietnamiensis]|nr:hypothetical protein BVI434_2240034 [Burkholderia vietnamiensis]
MLIEKRLPLSKSTFSLCVTTASCLPSITATSSTSVTNGYFAQPKMGWSCLKLGANDPYVIGCANRVSVVGIG